MNKIVKIHWALFYCLFFSNICYSQLDVNDLKKINIGVDLFSSRNNIKKNFTTKSNLYKVEDFSGVYKLEIENSIFNKCEKADYSFLYVYDTLSDMKIKYKYLYNKEENKSKAFFQTLEKLLTDLGHQNNNIRLNKLESNIDLTKIRFLINNIDSIHRSKHNIDNPYIFSGYNTYRFNFTTNDARLLFLDVGIWHGTHRWGGNEQFESIYLQITVYITIPRYLEYNSKYLGSSISVSDEKTIDLTFKDGVYSLPVNLNNVLSLDFILDMGASDISISPDVFLVLYKSGTIKETDFIGSETYQFADGSTSKSSVFNLSKIKIGDIELTNIRASISNNINSPLLLGQSALKKLSSYKIDNQNNKLIVELN